MCAVEEFNSLNSELNPICHLLALLGARHILHVSGIRVNKISIFNNYILQAVTGHRTWNGN